jgi:hypothetical protein
MQSDLICWQQERHDNNLSKSFQRIPGVVTLLLLITVELVIIVHFDK